MKDENGTEVTPRSLDVKKNRFDGDIGRVPFRFDRPSRRIVEVPPETDAAASAGAGALKTNASKPKPRKMAAAPAKAVAAAPTDSAAQTNPKPAAAAPKRARKAQPKGPVQPATDIVME